MIRDYYQLTKPGIIYGNALPAVAALVFGSEATFMWPTFVGMLIGLSLIIAAGCVINNILDRAIDSRMPRTKDRAISAGRIPSTHAWVFAGVLGVAGVAVLYLSTNMLALIIALAGFTVYVAAYTPLKPQTPWALFVGAVAGATPPVVGYTAAAGVLDQWTLWLFMALYLWQIPHFLAIATYRYSEYRAAGVPLFIQKEPSVRAKRFARGVFYASLVVLVVGCAGLMLQR